MDPGSPEPSRSRFTRCERRGVGAAVTVEVYDEQEVVVDLLRLGDVAARALADLCLWHSHLDLTLVDPSRITELNVTHMAARGPTDVLAFPMDGPEYLDGPVALREVCGGPSDGALECVHRWSPPTLPSPSAGPDASTEAPGVLLGDVVLCPQVAADQAERAGSTTADELALLTVHGILHLLGHDHAEREERAAMFDLTDLLLGHNRWRRDFGVD